MISSNQIFEKIDFRLLVHGDILVKESINAPSLGISQIANQDYSDARVVPDEFCSQKWSQIRYSRKSIFDPPLRVTSQTKNRSMLRAQASARYEIKTILMLGWSLMNSGHNGELKSDIRKNRISTPYRGHMPDSFPKSFKVNNSSSELKIRWPRDHEKM